MAKQQLEQKVCQRYGWSAPEFQADEQHFWSVNVTVGFNDCRHFVDSSAPFDPNTKMGIKQGKEAAAAIALAGLQEDIRREEAKPERELTDVFDPLPVYDSTTENWNFFWENAPTAVGIDTEGNQQTPPVLVQIATDDYVILEVPTGQGLSRDLERLLADDSIVKVFCDSFSQHDKTSLGLQVPTDLTVGTIVDLEAIASTLLGPVRSARGLPRIINLTMPELDVRIKKPSRAADRLINIGRFALIEQGRAPPLQGIEDLSQGEQQYAALDAWCTLYAYRRLQDHASAQ